MRKIHSLLVAACLLAASCNREEIQPETDKAGMYHITVAVTGTSPKGSVHIYNLRRREIQEQTHRHLRIFRR